MQTKDLILTVIGAVAMVLITMFNEEIKRWIMEHYKLLIFGIGFFCFALGIALMVIRKVVQNEI